MDPSGGPVHRGFGMGRNRVVAVLVTAIVVGMGFAGTAGAQAKECSAPAGRYEVSPPRGATDGADPAELAAANCQLGFREDRTYPLSVILLCLAATAGTLLLLRRGTSYEPIASQS